MLRLIVSDLVANRRIWLGALLIATATALVGAVVASDIQTAVAAGGTEALALYGLSGTVAAFTLVTALIVVGAVTNLTVTLQQRGYALWQLVGLSPGRVRLVVTTQLFTVSLLGGVAGCLLALPILRPLSRYAFAGSPELAALDPRFTPAGAVPVVLFVAVVITLGGFRGAGRAAHTPPIQSLREVEPPDRRMTVARWIGGLATAAVVAVIVATLPGTGLDTIAVPLMVISPLIAGVLAAFGPLFLARLVRAWTSLLPATASAAWFLARNSTAANVGRSTATISPLMVAVALAGGLYTANGAVGAPSGSLSTGTVVLLIGGPLLLAVLGAVATVFMSSRRRDRELALIVAAGGTPVVVLAAAAAEAVIYVGTAVLLGGFAVGVTSVIGAWAAGTWTAAGVVPSLAIAGLGLLLVLVATMVPTALALRNEVPRVLAPE
ncbi:FtsX-like permease family protein [Actinoplanes sp. M2I2]|uniref:FtsX-like permease family protein n=1 Tax=Actinoplanes sp. M2I2 TaxID=1734444 RepID=UPI002022583D|nr:FtsX-like permease family protein [Actinoplanes sp. M2I2]